MADGTATEIELVSLGDEVWAVDPETGEAGARPVTALIEGTGEKDLVTVTATSSVGDVGSVVATAGHPFWSVSDAAWVDAGDLQVGDALLQAEGSHSTVADVSVESARARVLNLTVAVVHTYFVIVGDAPTLVHNCGGRNALGQFTSEAGGESVATAAGRSAHNSYSNALGSSYDFNLRLPGSLLRPDAVDWTNRIVRELKPDNPKAISEGWRQVTRYQSYLQELTGDPWQVFVDVYSR